MADQTVYMSAARPGLARNIAGWILCAFLAFAFIGAGAGKLLSNPAMVQEFEQVGVGQWFRYFTGILEVGCGIGVLIPKYSRWAALLLVVVMCGAVVAHLTRLHSPPTLPATLLAIALLAAWLRR